MNDDRPEVKTPRGAERESQAGSPHAIPCAAMCKRLARIALGCLLFAALTAGACRLFLPERFAVNAPLGQLLLGRGGSAPPADRIGALLSVPKGFALDLWADGIPNARFLRITPAGDLLVSTPRSGRVLLIERDGDGDHRPDAVRPLLQGLDRPHGLDLYGGWLYVAETGAIARVRFDAASRRLEGEFERVVTGLPAGGNHWTRTVRFGPDGWMYVSIGSSCNVCLETDARRASIMRFRPDGSEGEIVATGLRNSVGFDWRPTNGELYATDNGRDLLGDDFPPCELNRIVPGGFYGWPFANGDRVPDPDLGAAREAEIAASIPPAHAFRAHNAPLGIAFLRGDAWPAAYREAAIVALHGSWNRTRKDGYQLVSLHWLPDGSIEERPFLNGLLRDDEAIGRPVDVVATADGTMYVSDDYAGAIYRIRIDDGSSQASPRPSRAPLGAVGDPLSALPLNERKAARERGAVLYESHACARCHDPAHADPGVVPVPISADHVRSRHGIESLADYLIAPTPPMPAFPLSQGNRRDLAVFLLSEGAR
jgi:glucose/arabinose dehydrogenase